MAVWLAKVTLEANDFQLDTGVKIRDSSAQRPCAARKQQVACLASVCDMQEPLDGMSARIFRLPRMEALRERIRAKQDRAATAR
eukprot:5674450-Karenia_brevis.AAC.1